jgi:hypothetical protein
MRTQARVPTITVRPEMTATDSVERHLGELSSAITISLWVPNRSSTSRRVAAARPVTMAYPAGGWTAGVAENLQIRAYGWSFRHPQASAGSFGARCAGVAAAQQVTVPAQDGVGRDDQRELSQGGSGDLVEHGSEERPVGRGEPWFIDSALQDGELVA